MKTKIAERQDEFGEIKFPVLMKGVNSPLVVLFTSEECGLVVVGFEDKEVGSYDTDWVKCSNVKKWKKFPDSIILSND